MKYCYAMFKVMEGQLVPVVVVFQSINEVIESIHVNIEIIEESTSHEHSINKVYLRLFSVKVKYIEIKTFKAINHLWNIIISLQYLILLDYRYFRITHHTHLICFHLFIKSNLNL